MSEPLRILAIGAHPDVCEWAAGGTAAKWAARGDRVRFVSLTNGELGHWKTVGPPLAARRRAEVGRAAGIHGVECGVLDTPDGTLPACLEPSRYGTDGFGVQFVRYAVRIEFGHNVLLTVHVILHW